HFAEEGSFAGGVFWLAAEKPDLSATWGTVIAEALNIPAGMIEQRTGQVIRQLERAAEPILIVLDNVTAWSHFRHPYPLPNGTHVTYLVTTRDQGLAGARFRKHRLDTLDHKASSSLLLSLSNRTLDVEPGFTELVEYLDGYTLAVELAGALLGEFP